MQKNKDAILVTGGAGFIGSHMVDRLVADGYDVTVFDNLSTGEKKFLNPKATFVKGDVLDKKQVRDLFKKKFNAVFHLAGSASAINSFTDPEKDVRTNFFGTINIVNACVENGVSRLLYASSMTCYGKTGNSAITEKVPCIPISYYGISKYSSERFVHATASRVDLKKPLHVTSFRMFNVYGPRQSLTNPYQGVMAIFIGNVLRKEAITIYGDGKQSRDFVFVEDVVNAWVGSIHNTKTYGQIYNVGQGVDTSITKLTQTIVKILHPKDNYPVYYRDTRPGDQRHTRASTAKIKKDIGWKPKYNLVSGLEKTITWAKEHNR